MDFLSLILFAVAAIFSAFVCKQNMNLSEQLAAAENRLLDLESHRSQSADLLSALEDRVSNAVRLAERSSSGQLSEIQGQVRNALETQLHDFADLPQFKNHMIRQLEDLQNNFKMHHADIGTLSKRHNELANSAVQADTNMCVLGTRDVCPKGFTRVGTFGTILHTPTNIIGKGFYVNGEYTPGWEWYHGGMCCKETEPKTVVPK